MRHDSILTSTLISFVPKAASKNTLYRRPPNKHIHTPCISWSTKAWTMVDLLWILQSIVGVEAQVVLVWGPGGERAETLRPRWVRPLWCPTWSCVSRRSSRTGKKEFCRFLMRQALCPSKSSTFNPGTFSPSYWPGGWLLPGMLMQHWWDMYCAFLCLCVHNTDLT